MSEENKKAITKSLINEVMDEARRQRLAPNPDDIARATQGLKDGAPCMFTICQYHNPLHTPVCFLQAGLIIKTTNAAANRSGSSATTIDRHRQSCVSTVM
jgi:hypothetical protein